MASLATLAAVQPATVNGLAGSSLNGTKLSFKSSHQSFRSKKFRYLALFAKVAIGLEEYHINMDLFSSLLEEIRKSPS